MLNTHDISQMEIDIYEVLSDWEDRVEIWNMLPANQQPDWDPIMREIVGETRYNKITNVPAERRDITLHSNITTNAGDDDVGRAVICISSIYKDNNGFAPITINIDSIIIFDGEQWRVSTINPKLGEIMVGINRLTGR